MSELMGYGGVTGTLIEGSSDLKHRHFGKAGGFLGNAPPRPAYDGYGGDGYGHDEVMK